MNTLLNFSVLAASILIGPHDIVVISANPSLLAGSGISGIIHKAARPQLKAAAKPFAPLTPGQAIITTAFNLPAKYLIHTVCPRHMDGQRDESEQLDNAYASVLALHSEAPDAKSIAFVSMGTGVYKWPIELSEPRRKQHVRNYISTIYYFIELAVFVRASGFHLL